MSLKTSYKTSPATWAYIALLAVQIIYGFNYAASRVVLEQYSPVFWGGVRMMLSGVLMLALSFQVVPRAKRTIGREFWWKTFFYGVVGLGLNQAFFMLGLFKTTTANSAILNTLTPIFTLLFAILMKQERFTFRRGAGFFVAVLGAVIICKFEDFHLSSQTFQGDVITVLNCVALAFFFAFSRDFLLKTDPFWATAWMFVFGGAVLMLVTPSHWHELATFRTDSTFLWAVFYNVVAASIITYFLNSWALTKVNASSVALFIYLQPVVAVLNGWFTYGEAITKRMVVAMICIFLGVGLGVIKKKS